MRTVLKFAIIVCFAMLCACSSNNSMRQARADIDHRDYARAYDELLVLAKRGNPEAQYAIGYMLYYGMGAAKDEALARQWIRRAADKDYPEAIIALKMIVHDKIEHEPDLVAVIPESAYRPTKTPPPGVEWFRQFLKKKELV